MNRSEQILQAARDLAKACSDARAARDARNGSLCELARADVVASAEDGVIDPAALDARPDHDPCWKSWDTDDGQTFSRADEEEWCASCRQRERHHNAYREAMQRRGRALRRIQAHYRAEVRA